MPDSESSKSGKSPRRQGKSAKPATLRTSSVLSVVTSSAFHSCLRAFVVNTVFARHHGLTVVPSGLLTGSQTPDVLDGGNFFARFSSKSIPHPGASFTTMYPFFIVGHPGNMSRV